MEISNGMMSVTTAQLQARFEAAQSSRALASAETAAKKAEHAVTHAGTPAQKDEAMARLTKVSRDFESIFLAYLLKTMRDTVPKSDFLGHSRESEIFGSMRDEELAKNLAQSGGIGLSRLLVEQLKKTL